MRPLPAVLLDLHEDIVTGRLILRRGKVSKSVDLVNGNPVSAASTPRDETLGHFLTSSGVITEEQHREAVARAAKHGNKLGEALVAMRVPHSHQALHIYRDPLRISHLDLAMAWIGLRSASRYIVAVWQTG